MVSLSAVRAIFLTVGPFLVPRLISWYRSQRSPPPKNAADKQRPIPLPPYAIRSLYVLFLTAVLFLISTLPYFSPPNIFVLTGSRLQIPLDTLFTRLSTTAHPSEALKPKLLSMDSRLLYLTHGPSAIEHCTFCNSDDPFSYIYYSLPTIAIPHLLHLLALGLATSPTLTGAAPSKWRTTSAVAGILIGVADVWTLATYDHRANLRSTLWGNIDHFYWRMRTTRAVVIAAADAVLALLIYLSATQRAFTVPPTPAERIEAATRLLEGVNGKMHALGVTRNALVRDEGLRAKVSRYWEVEGKVMGEVFEDREVVDGVRAACGRADVVKITADAEKYAAGFVGGLQFLNGDGPSPGGVRAGEGWRT
ncbi:MAG: hypothetical protein M1833_005311 [Piccolia ochrophora]|nr:MAG: hypothetical protein M1833_005311 [Piccolia ochrophora]